jgi:hypothetical protein
MPKGAPKLVEHTQRAKRIRHSLYSLSHSLDPKGIWIGPQPFFKIGDISPQKDYIIFFIKKK